MWGCVYSHTLSSELHSVVIHPLSTGTFPVVKLLTFMNEKKKSVNSWNGLTTGEIRAEWWQHVSRPWRVCQWGGTIPHSTPLPLCSWKCPSCQASFLKLCFHHREGGREPYEEHSWHLEGSDKGWEQVEMGTKFNAVMMEFGKGWGMLILSHRTAYWLQKVPCLLFFPANWEKST